MTAPPPIQPKPDVPAWRLLATLGVGGAAAGFLLVFVFQLTAPIIERNKAERLAAAVQEVLRAPHHYDTLYVVDDALTTELPGGADPADYEQVYRGFAEDGAPVGYAIAAGEPGFQDIVRVIFGFDPTTHALLGMKVLESKETPGLGDRIEKDSAFVNQFAGVLSPLQGVKAREGTGDPHEIDMITGATISSRTVIRVINNALERLEPLLVSYTASVPAALAQEAGR